MSESPHEVDPAPEGVDSAGPSLAARRPWGRWAWIVNLACLAILLLWIVLDPGFERFGILISGKFFPRVQQIEPFGYVAWTPEHIWRLFFLAVVALFALISCGVILWKLLRGLPQQRSLGRVFAIVSMLAAWLAMIVTWKDAAYLGKSWRLRGEVAALRPIAEQLQKDWPTSDGRLEGLGRFTAYTIARPTTLILLTPPTLAGRPRAITTVNQAAPEILLFELAGAERGVQISGGGIEEVSLEHIDWLVWSPTGPPQEFKSGLGAEYKLVKYRPIHGDWYLARYAVTEQY